MNIWKIKIIFLLLWNYAKIICRISFMKKKIKQKNFLKILFGKLFKDYLSYKKQILYIESINKYKFNINFSIYYFEILIKYNLHFTILYNSLKMDNIMIGFDGFVKIVDFGFAK